jgi:hypothetical protein
MTILDLENDRIVPIELCLEETMRARRVVQRRAAGADVDRTNVEQLDLQRIARIISGGKRCAIIALAKRTESQI